MARMYPSFFPKDSKSSGEKEVFDNLKANAPSDWIVLHSFRLPKHSKVVFGEADFIVLAPECGIIVLEIKSGGVGFDGTDWLFINRYHEITRKPRGPFEQAREAMFELEKIITGKLGQGYERTRIPYGYGVIFTDESRFPASEMTEDESWRLIQNNVPKDYVSFIRRLARNFEKELHELGKKLPGTFSRDDARTVAEALRPEIECVAPLKSFLEQSEKDIIALTEQQYGCLIDTEVNDRVVIQGGAGTGKTLLAVEDARRSVQAGKKTGLFCFNVNLATMIRRTLDEPKVTVRSFHSYLTSLCGKTADGEDSDYFRYELPERAMKVLDSGEFEKFDKIIVDEFQDLCVLEYLDCFDLMLKGGLFDGNFTFYGDFAGQAIYDRDVSLDTLKDRTFFANKKLTVNCRNTEYIGNELVNVTGYSDEHYLLSVTGEPVDYRSWNDIDEEKELLKKTIRELSGKGLRSGSVMILSPKKRDNSVVMALDPQKSIIGDQDDVPDAFYARFSTVQAFKGLESEAVVLVDIDSYDDVKLMYVALSRARSKLIVLESKNAAKQRKKLTIWRI